MAKWIELSGDGTEQGPTWLHGPVAGHDLRLQARPGGRGEKLQFTSPGQWLGGFLAFGLPPAEWWGFASSQGSSRANSFLTTS